MNTSSVLDAKPGATKTTPPSHWDNTAAVNTPCPSLQEADSVYSTVFCPVQICHMGENMIIFTLPQSLDGIRKNPVSASPILSEERRQHERNRIIRSGGVSACQPAVNGARDTV